MSLSDINPNMGVNIDSFYISYILNRMKEMDFTLFHFEPYLVVLTKNNPQFVINGQNEFYYLTSSELALGTEIEADNNYFKVNDYYSYMEVTKLQEFSGSITITLPAGLETQAVEFIRVIPRHK